jgi:putative ABC transport system permease protein
MFQKQPVAWLQLKHQKTRFLIALSGVIFAVVIVFMQFGIRDALFDSAVHLHRGLNGDIFLISPRSTSLIAMDTFPDRRLKQVLAFPDVDYTVPIYVGFAQWKNPQTRNYWRNIYLIGFDTRYDAFNLPGIENTQVLNIRDNIFFDQESRAEFGPIVEQFKANKIVTTEVSDFGSNHKVNVVGLFNLGTSFGADGNIITSDLNFLRINATRNKGIINIGLIKLKSGANLSKNLDQIKRYLPKDVKIFSKEEFINFEKAYWQSSTAIGFIFDIGVTLGIVVGIVVVYQILYTNVSEHLPEYATLKAMGYRQQYLLGLVLQQSLFIAILGYIPGFFITIVQYEVTKQATLLPIGMTLDRAIFVFLATLIMCFIAGGSAVRKLKDADPADIF